jgi:predicted ATPase
MVTQWPGRTFISYSRRDGAGFAAWLRGWLGERNLSVWQDIVALEGGRDWWSQIEDALKSKTLQHFILVVTPASLASAVVRREIRLARQEGKTASPVKGPGLGDLGNLPRWLGQIYDLDLVEHQTTLVRVLEAESWQKRVPMMAPEPPPDFVPRPKEFDALKGQLLDAKGDAVAGITAALKGAGGYGKTTLAKALAHDPDIQDAYFDGILWAELGEKPERLLSILTDQIELLTGERPGLETLNAASGKLGEALGDRRILMVVDDAWREQDLRPFLQGGSNCVRLVTTRIDSVLPTTALRQPVDAMQTSEALNLLSAGLSPDQISRGRAELAKLAARLGEWAQLLKIVNGFLRDRAHRAKESLPVAIAGANKRLDAKSLVAFDPRDETDRAKTVARTIGVSLELLSETERAAFGDLGVFPEDTEIPVGVAARMWAATVGLEEFVTEDVLSRLFDLSLLLDLDLGQRFFRLHDTIRHFLRDRTGKDGLVAQHKQLVAALNGVGSEDSDARTRRYFYLFFPHHLAEAGEREMLDTLLLDPAWLQSKFEATKNMVGLIADYRRYGASKTHWSVGRKLGLISGICMRYPNQLLPQLIGRLLASETLLLRAFVQRARTLLPKPTIIPIRRASITHRVEDDQFFAYRLALCLLTDGRLASAHGKTIRLWDSVSGIETLRLEGHTERVTALCPLPDGRLASSSYDGTIRVWDTAAGTEMARLGSSKATALCLLADGRLVSASRGTIEVWDLATGAETARLGGSLYEVIALCPLPNGLLASDTWSSAVRLWDVATGEEVARFELDAGLSALIAITPNRVIACDRRGLLYWLEVVN